MPGSLLPPAPLLRHVRPAEEVALVEAAPADLTSRCPVSTASPDNHCPLLLAVRVSVHLTGSHNGLLIQAVE
jgi:hypothetical protein